MMNYRPGLKILLALVPVLIAVIVFASRSSGSNVTIETPTPTPTITPQVSTTSTTIVPTALPSTTPLPTSIPTATRIPSPTPIVLPTIPIPTATSTSIPTPIILNPTTAPPVFPTTEIFTPTPTPTISPTSTISPTPTITPTPTASPTPVIIPIVSNVLVEEIGPKVIPFNLNFGDYVVKVTSQQDIKITITFFGGCTRTLVDGIGPHISSHIIKISNPTRCEGPSLLPGEKFDLSIETTGEYTISFVRQYPNIKSLPESNTSWGTKLLGPYILTKDISELWIRTEVQTDSLEVVFFSLNNVTWTYTPINQSNAARSSIGRSLTSPSGTYLIYIRTEDNIPYTYGIE